MLPGLCSSDALHSLVVVGFSSCHCESCKAPAFDESIFCDSCCVLSGNYEGERPYVEGDRCSSCPEKMQNCQNNLCGTNHITSSQPTCNTYVSQVFVFCLFCVVEEDEGDDAGNSSESWTDIDPSAPYEETFPTSSTGESADVPPPATTETLVQPVATTDQTTNTTTSTSSAAAPTTTASTVQGPKVTVPSTTWGPTKWTPQNHSTVKHETATKTMKEQEEKVKRTTRPVGQEVKTERGPGKRPTGLDRYPEIQRSRSSTLVPSLLLACVSSVFSLRL